MWKDPLGDKLANGGGPALGCWANDPDMVELLAHMGFDWVMFDQMFTSSDWGKIELLIRTAEAAGITPTVRLPAYPWLGNDPALARSVGRVAGIGAKYIRISVADIEEMRSCATVANDWHYKPMHLYRLNDQAPDESDKSTCLWPLAETKEVVESYKEIIEMPEVKIFGFGMGDASMAMAGTSRPDFYNEKLWQFIDGAVAHASKHDCAIGANTSYAPTIEELGRRAAKIARHGVKVIMLQGAPFLFQIAIAPFLKDLRDEIAETGQTAPTD